MIMNFENIYNKIELSEIFFSLQGESTYSGLPCIFIRFAKCNLNCKYCDTKYAFKTSFLLSIKEIISKIKSLSNTKLVEITGGEPLLQSTIYSLFEELDKNNYTILLETNGSKSLQSIPDYVIKIVDVKCPGSGEGDSFIMKNLQFLHKNDELKFVLTDLEDYRFAKNFIFTNNLNCKILLSTITPGLSPKVISEKILEDQLDVRLQLQLHKYIGID